MWKGGGGDQTSRLWDLWTLSSGQTEAVHEHEDIMQQEIVRVIQVRGGVWVEHAGGQMCDSYFLTLRYL